jgi:hypothetical protein
VALFEDTNLCAIHAKRVTIMPKVSGAQPHCFLFSPSPRTPLPRFSAQMNRRVPLFCVFCLGSCVVSFMYAAGVGATHWCCGCGCNPLVLRVWVQPTGAAGRGVQPHRTYSSRAAYVGSAPSGAAAPNPACPSLCVQSGIKTHFESACLFLDSPEHRKPREKRKTTQKNKHVNSPAPPCRAIPLDPHRRLIFGTHLHFRRRKKWQKLVPLF